MNTEREVNPGKELPRIHTRTVGHHIDNLLGRILTFVDASTSDPIQRKAWKDIIKNNFYDTAHDISQDSNTEIFDKLGVFSEILINHSRPLDPEMDLDSEGKLK